MLSSSTAILLFLTSVTSVNISKNANIELKAIGISMGINLSSLSFCAMGPGCRVTAMLAVRHHSF